MELETWREAQKYTLGQLAVVLEIPGTNPARTVQRYCTGASEPSPEMREQIARLTGNAVLPNDMHMTRLRFLRGGRPARPGEGVSVVSHHDNQPIAHKEPDAPGKTRKNSHV